MGDRDAGPHDRTAEGEVVGHEAGKVCAWCGHEKVGCFVALWAGEEGVWAWDAVLVSVFSKLFDALVAEED